MMQPAKESIDIGLVVSDINASLQFYQTLLGLKKIEEMQVSFGTLHRLRLGMSDIKLIDPQRKPAAGAIGVDQQLGIRYMTFVVQDLAGLIQQLEAAKVEFTVPRTVLGPNMTIAMVKDPDGNIVEFCEGS